MKYNSIFQNGSQRKLKPAIGIASMIDEWLFASQNNRGKGEKAREKFWPSELACCSREIYFKWKGLYAARHRPATLRMMEDGTVAEERITRYLKEMGVLVASQKPLPENPYFTGRVDHLFKKDGQLYINEFKRVNDKFYNHLKSQAQPAFAHAVQLNVYLWAFQLGLGTILYENRNTSDFLDFTVRKSEGMLKWVFEKVRKLRWYIDNDIEPPRCRSTGRWTCFYCYSKKHKSIDEEKRYENLILKPSPKSIGVLGWMDPCPNHAQPK